MGAFLRGGLIEERGLNRGFTVSKSRYNCVTKTYKLIPLRFLKHYFLKE